MYNDGDQLEFLQTVDLEVSDIPNIDGIELWNITEIKHYEL
jgi:hypothetical protein